jgi:hypothetical protein
LDAELRFPLPKVTEEGRAARAVVFHQLWRELRPEVIGRFRPRATGRFPLSFTRKMKVLARPD